MSLQQIANELGVTNERVRQILNKALKKLRREFKRRGIENPFQLIDERDHHESQREFIK